MLKIEGRLSKEQLIQLKSMQPKKKCKECKGHLLHVPFFAWPEYVYDGFPQVVPVFFSVCTRCKSFQVDAMKADLDEIESCPVCSPDFSSVQH
ncbi:hypothetical protein D8Y20_07820 [Mariprofundus sp. EBB-1]|uniref:hypothetical protein n=1 Tax=Mariprofundus sp. EBB-1 TaxID=2650971 RepID=UPI000EF19952|nr:hypothetical protein [Mariprofundus sp. EBB-1]RLL52180.1 hypothetical protein D8Y20_07820 [Mariprofundus sp. EBB-1]